MVNKKVCYFLIQKACKVNTFFCFDKFVGLFLCYKDYIIYVSLFLIDYHITI